MVTIKTLAVFCGSCAGNSACFGQAVEDLADVLTLNNIDVVYGGSKEGLMGILANRLLQNNSKVIGVIPKSLVDVEIAHESLYKLHIVDSMHKRKEVMAQLSDGFIMLPGGLGSLDEFFEMATWAQLGYHAKPCGILNTDGYYNALLEFLDNATQFEFIKAVHRNMLLVETNAFSLIPRFLSYEPPIEIKVGKIKPI